MKKILKTVFEPLKLAKLDNNHHSASPMELFFDLIFVAGIASAAHFFIHLNNTNLFLAITIFFSIYTIWLNFSIFMMKFWGSSYILRLLLFFVMVPMVLFSSVTDTGNGSIRVLLIGFFLSRLVLGIAWLIVFFQNRKIEKNKKMEILLNSAVFLGTSCLLVLMSFIYEVDINIYLIYVSLLLTLEVSTFFFYYQNRRKKKIYSELNYSLLKERHMLFIILLFGEGIISIVVSIEWNNINIVDTFFQILFAFGAVYFFFLRVYEEGIFVPYNQENILGRLVSHVVTCMNILLLYANMHAVLNDVAHLNKSNVYLLMGSLLYITIRHAWRDLSIRPKTAFIYADLYSFIIMFILIVSLAVAENATIVLLLLFLFFFVHSIPTVFRYQKFKENLLGE